MFQLAMKIRIVQAKSNLKIFLKSWDVEIYVNVRQISLTQMIKRYEFFFMTNVSSFSALFYFRKELYVPERIIHIHGINTVRENCFKLK